LGSNTCLALKLCDLTARYMDNLTRDAVREIEQIHSSWIAFEVAGHNHRLVTLCAEDIELWPPDGEPVLGRAAVSGAVGAWNRQNSRRSGHRLSDSRFKGDCLLDCELQDYVFLGGRVYAQTSSRKPSVDIGEAFWQVGCQSRELVCAPTVVKITGF
jgi:hypothetical protein